MIDFIFMTKVMVKIKITLRILNCYEQIINSRLTKE